MLAELRVTALKPFYQIALFSTNESLLTVVNFSSNGPLSSPAPHPDRFGLKE